MSRKSNNLTHKELNSLNARESELLSTLSRFYYEVITSNQTGIISKPTPRQFYDFVKKELKPSKRPMRRIPNAKTKVHVERM